MNIKNNKLKIATRLKIRFSPTFLIFLAFFLIFINANQEQILGRTFPTGFYILSEGIIGLLFFAKGAWQNRAELKQSDRAARISLIMSAILAGVLTTLTFDLSIVSSQATPKLLPLLVLFLLPISAIILGKIVLKEEISTKLVVMGLAILLGIYLATNPLLPLIVPSNFLSNMQLLSNLLMLVAALAWGTSLVFNKLSQAHFSNSTILFCQAVTILITGGILIAVQSSQNMINLKTATVNDWLSLVVIAVIWVFAQFLIFRVLAVLTSQKVSLYFLFFPISTMILITLTGGKIITQPVQIIGMIIVTAVSYRFFKTGKF